MNNPFRPAPEIPPLPQDQVDAEYRRLRRRVFLGIFIGYVAYYLVRKNFALAIPDILAEHPEYTKAQLGTAMTGLSIAYGLSKFLMGSVSDRSNPRWFMTAGLLFSCGITLAFGCVKAIYASLALVIVLQTLNGWVNGMGWPPCGKTMVHWFGARERGRTVSLWNISHNIGGALVASLAMFGVWLFSGDWGAKFSFNALVALVMAAITFWLLRDTPQSCGLPPIEVYKGEAGAGYSAEKEKTLDFRAIFFRHIFPNKLLWAIAFANAFVYFVRYGVVDWIPTYLQQAKHFDFDKAGAAWSLFEYAAIPGTILCGWLSDTVFKGRRAPASILFMLCTLGGVALYACNQHGPLWIDYVALFVIGFFIYGPIMLIGLHALELVPKKAAGTAAGFTGFFGYVFGSAFAGTGVGWIADHWGWNGVFSAMALSCLLAIAFTAITLRENPRRIN
ncbi:MAG: glycerol-3-phosphate transporter [Verrucomicrobiota bacterium]|jgi:OPA family glycerol-3-phosphate transporter-like MFS transporter